MISKVLRRFGWVTFALMWIPFVGIFIISMIEMPEGSYSWSELPPLFRVSLISTGGLFLLSVFGLVGAPVASWLSNRRIQRSGQRAEAEVLKLWDTGMTINEHPVVRLRLRVCPLAGAPFEAETESLIPRLQVPQVQPGARVEVRFDPRSKAVALHYS